MAFSRGLEVALTDCPPSPCTRLSRALTTTEAPPPIRDVTGLGGLPRFATRGARIGVPMFKGTTLGAVGGWLYPWPYRRVPDSGLENTRTHIGCTQSIRVDDRARTASPPFGSMASVQRLPAPTSARVDTHPCNFTIAPVVARLGQTPLRTFQTVRLLQAAVPISATFTVPFCTRPDPGEDDEV